MEKLTRRTRIVVERLWEKRRYLIVANRSIILYFLGRDKFAGISWYYCLKFALISINTYCIQIFMETSIFVRNFNLINLIK